MTSDNFKVVVTLIPSIYEESIQLLMNLKRFEFLTDSDFENFRPHFNSV